MEHRDTLFDSLVVYVESHCVCGINPFGEGIEQEEQFQLLSQRLLLALQLPGLRISVNAHSLSIASLSLTFRLRDCQPQCAFLIPKKLLATHHFVHPLLVRVIYRMDPGDENIHQPVKNS